MSLTLTPEESYWSHRSHMCTLEHEQKTENLYDEQALNLFTTLKPKVSKDGDMFCILLGENLQEGLCGFGKTFRKAVDNFFLNYHQETINKKEK